MVARNPWQMLLESAALRADPTLASGILDALAMLGLSTADRTELLRLGARGTGADALADLARGAGDDLGLPGGDVEAVRALTTQLSELAGSTGVPPREELDSLTGQLSLQRVRAAPLVVSAVAARHADRQVAALLTALLAVLPTRALVSALAEALRGQGSDAQAILDLLREIIGRRRSETASAAPEAPEDTGGSPWRGGGTPPPGEGPPGRHTAFPRVTVPGAEGRANVVLVDRPFDVTVGLAPRPDRTLVAAGPIEVFPGSIDILLLTDPESITVSGSARHTLTVSAETPYPTTTISMTAQFGERLGVERRIGALFMQDGAVVGVAWRSIAVADIEADLGTVAAPAVRAAAQLDLGSLIGEDAPDLVLAVTRADDDDDRFVWSAYAATPGLLVPDLPGSRRLGSDIAGFATQLRRTISFDKRSAGGLFRELAGRARLMGEAIPPGIQATLRALVAQPGRTRAPTVLLLTEEVFVPWEIAELTDAPATSWGGTSPFLGAQVAIGRWPLDEREPRPQPQVAVTVAHAAVLTADYTGVQRWAKLDQAVAEAQEVGALFAPAAEIQATVAAVGDLLDGTPPADLVHVALHGQFDQTGAGDGLVLLRTEASGAVVPEFFTPAMAAIGRLNRGPLVFLNACQVGSDNIVLGSYGGFASVLLRAGAGCVVAPLWNVDDVVAARVARTFYARTWSAGEPVSAAEAIRSIRAEYTREGAAAETAGVHPTLIAFQVFGHPNLLLHEPLDQN